MNRYETHCHTSEASACAGAPGEAQVKFYKERGFKGIIITDHFLNGNTRAPAELPWEERVNILCSGYENAKKAGDKAGLDVFFGWEYAYQGADFLTYGLDKQWLLKHPEIMEMTPGEYFDFAHSEGAFICHAHPFREDWYIDHIHLFPRKCDACEVINSWRKPLENEMARIYAEKYGLIPTAGSDNHRADQSRLSGIETDKDIRNIADFIDILRSGDYRIFDETG